MQNLLGGLKAPPPSGCYGVGVVCIYPYPDVDHACCGGLDCVPLNPSAPNGTRSCRVALVVDP